MTSRYISKSRVADGRKIWAVWYEQGATINEIAEKVGMHYSTVLRTLDDLDVPRRPPGGMSTRAFMDRAPNMVLEGA
ncbi:hypothetical protein HUW46_02085 [Amycolatopsis sp. CA-230715]|nr:hypothetical protein HUW46_02085 [Amycolatopsis sp. CA-230715]